MKRHVDRVESIVLEKRVKLHIFEPSQRKIWTVVGKGKEHWVDPSGQYCSCMGYHFGRLHGKTSCYHLASVALAQKKRLVEEVVFSDEEFSDFILGLISEL